MKTRFKSFLMAATIFLFLCLITAAPANVWFLITYRSYTVPAESTIFSFEPTLMNDADENSWTYGKDNERFYYHGLEGADYFMVSRTDAMSCSGFNEHDFKTWCTQYVNAQGSDYNTTVGKGSIGF